MNDNAKVTDARRKLVELQRLLLPPTLPAIGCTEAAVHYRSHNDAFRIGGDWYDLIDRPDDRVVALVGDVVGHGATEISAMGQLRAASNALGRVLPDPAAILTALDAFAVDVPGASMASAAVLMLDGTTTVRYALAGHPPPIVVCTDGSWRLLDSTPGRLLGLGGDRVTETFMYDVGDVVVLHTDGLYGKHDPADAVEAAADVVSQHVDAPCHEIAELVADTAADTPDDDIVVMALRPRHHRGDDYRLTDRTAPSVVFRH